MSHPKQPLSIPLRVAVITMTTFWKFQTKNFKQEILFISFKFLVFKLVKSRLHWRSESESFSLIKALEFSPPNHLCLIKVIIRYLLSLVCIFYTTFIKWVHKCCINICLSSINFNTCINLYIFYARIKNIHLYKKISAWDVSGWYFLRVYTVYKLV